MFSGVECTNCSFWHCVIHQVQVVQCRCDQRCACPRSLQCEKFGDTREEFLTSLLKRWIAVLEVDSRLSVLPVFSAMLGSTVAGGESFSPDDAYDSAWNSVKPMKGKSHNCLDPVLFVGRLPCGSVCVAMSCGGLGFTPDGFTILFGTA